MTDQAQVQEEAVVETVASIDTSQFEGMSIDDLEQLEKTIEVAAYVRWQTEVEETGLIDKSRDCGVALATVSGTGQKSIWEYGDIQVEVSPNQSTVVVRHQGQVVLNNQTGKRGISRRIGTYIPGAWVNDINEQHPTALTRIEARRDQQVAIQHQAKVSKLLAEMQKHAFHEIPSLPAPKFEVGAWVKVVDPDAESYFTGKTGQITGYDPANHINYYQVDLVDEGVVNIHVDQLEATPEPEQRPTPDIKPRSAEGRFELYIRLFRERAFAASYIANAMLTFTASSFSRRSVTVFSTVMRDSAATIAHRRVAAQALSQMSTEHAVIVLLEALEDADKTISDMAAAALAEWEGSDKTVVFD